MGPPDDTEASAGAHEPRGPPSPTSPPDLKHHNRVQVLNGQNLSLAVETAFSTFMRKFPLLSDGKVTGFRRRRPGSKLWTFRLQTSSRRYLVCSRLTQCFSSKTLTLADTYTLPSKADAIVNPPMGFICFIIDSKTNTKKKRVYAQKTFAHFLQLATG